MLDLDPPVVTGGLATEPVRLTLFGKMRVSDAAGHAILPRNRKSCAVLAILALNRGAPVSRLCLTSLLWSRRDAEQARGSLRQCLHELQDRLHLCAPNLLVAERAYLSLRVNEFAMDVPGVDGTLASRDQMLAQLDSGLVTEGASLLLEDLVGLDDAFSTCLSGQRRRLSEQAIAVAEAALGEALPGRPEWVQAAAERLLRIAPVHEAAYRALMSARAALGDPNEAARAFERCAAAMARAKQGPPSTETRLLAERIRASATLDPPPVAASKGRSHNGADNIRLGVMPFRPLGPPTDNAGEVALCVGLAEEITTALARFRGIFLIASSSLLALSAHNEEARAGWASLREELRLDFILDGTVQRGGDKVRVNVRLVDLRAADPGGPTPGGEVVWSRRFDRPATDLLALQDEIAAQTVAQVDPALMLRVARRLRLSAASDQPARMSGSISAHEMLLRAIPAIYRMEEDSFRAAGVALAEAVAHGPDHPGAHAWYACWQLFLVGQGWTDEPAAAMRHARRLADRAVSLDPTDARGLAIAGHVRAFDRRSIDEALALHERALDLNPNLPLAWVLAGLGISYAGQHELAARRIEQARKLSPFDPHSFFFDTALGVPLLLLGRHAESLEASRRAAAMKPTLSSSYKGYLAALGHLTRDENGVELQEDIVRVRGHLERLEPNFTLTSARARSPLRREQDIDVYIDGLRRGGLREA